MKIIVKKDIIEDFKVEDSKLLDNMYNIKRDIQSNDEDDTEFFWFVREFSKFYCYHLKNVLYRIKNIEKLYKKYINEFENKTIKSNLLEYQTSNDEINIIYWEFEALLNVISVSVDLITRIAGVSYVEDVPLTFNKLTKKTSLGGIVNLLIPHRDKWITDMKDYRDCFVHYTPVDSRVFITFTKEIDKWNVCCRIPLNPNARNVEEFDFSERKDLLEYSNKVIINLLKLDKDIGEEIFKLYQQKKYPLRNTSLLKVGRRTR